MQLKATAHRDVIRVLDSYDTPAVLLLANFFLLEMMDDPRWGAIGQHPPGGRRPVVAISDPDAGERASRRRR